VSDRALLEAYRATRWSVGRGHTAVEVTVGSEAPPTLRPSGIVTAWNPASRPATPEQNRRADAALRRRIRALGLPALRTRAHGVGDPAWDEPGWCVSGISLPHLLELGRAFGQNAVLWIDSCGTPRLVVSWDGFCGQAVGTVL
jgi:hypothetical protein